MSWREPYLVAQPVTSSAFQQRPLEVLRRLYTRWTPSSSRSMLTKLGRTPPQGIPSLPVFERGAVRRFDYMDRFHNFRMQRRIETRKWHLWP
jgi:hypothetical protein